MRLIDLRSDTVTQPCKKMRKAIMNAEVGDDVFGDDPTVTRLQEKICEITGKEASLFVTSGTQANQVSINAHTQPGDEIICEYRSHIFNYESGAPALLSGVQLHPLKGPYGVLNIDEIRQAIRPQNDHFPRTRMITIENTHNRWGGTIYPLENIKKTKALADEYSLKMHLDGARLWNASVSSGVRIKEYASHFDSLSMCFSKGLGAPAGSIIAGDNDFIKRAHYYRKVYGGGLRQAGILAAAAIYALENNIDRLADDHRRAKKLAQEIQEIPGFKIDMKSVQTNIIIIDTSSNICSASQIVRNLNEKGIRITSFAPDRLRLVTHLDITDQDIDRTLKAFESLKQS